MSRTILAQRSRLSCSLAVGVLVIGALAVAASAAERKKAATTAKADNVEMFAAIERGDIEVKLVVKDDTEANVLIKNKTKRPLNVGLPEAFAGVPVFAQLGAGLGNNNNDGDDNNQNQAVGGGMMGGHGGRHDGRHGIQCCARESWQIEGRMRLPGARQKDPNPRVQYEIKKIDDFTKDAKVHEVLKMLASGKVPQRIAQAATWHFANDMSWDQLAAKKVNRLGVPDTAYFTQSELRAALQVSMAAEKLADAKKDSQQSSSSGESLSKR